HRALLLQPSRPGERGSCRPADSIAPLNEVVLYRSDRNLSTPSATCQRQARKVRAPASVHATGMPRREFRLQPSSLTFRDQLVHRLDERLDSAHAIVERGLLL